MCFFVVGQGIFGCKGYQGVYALLNLSIVYY